MFDILSKLGEIKNKAAIMKINMEEKCFYGYDSSNLVTIKTNGKKDVIDIKLADGFTQLSSLDQEKALKEAISKALKESESFIISELKNIVPNIPGINIFE